jgi:hypothetical protein
VKDDIYRYLIRENGGEASPSVTLLASIDGIEVRDNQVARKPSSLKVIPMSSRSDVYPGRGTDRGVGGYVSFRQLRTCPL